MTDFELVQISPVKVFRKILPLPENLSKNEYYIQSKIDEKFVGPFNSIDEATKEAEKK